ncbi:MAG: LPS export ABC transporter periplasmic protein LptC [Proteobacteria bacterium]|nr:LPS export ABC transporter periplasmic protein LptC [Pseudomonadota bacterium]MBU1710024.1 LPS export ABC transporter periplasmic protein LptC [Pseudomonadota bacterium]
MSGPRNLLWILPLILVAASPIWWPLAGSFLKPRGDFTSKTNMLPPPPRTFTLEGVNYIQTTGGKEELRLITRKISTLADETQLAMEEVRATLYNTAGDPLEIDGGVAFYDTSKQILTMLDNVQVAGRDGYEVRTDALRYMVKDRTIKSAELVELEGKNIKVKGQGLFYDLDTGAFRVGGRVFFDTW